MSLRFVGNGRVIELTDVELKSDLVHHRSGGRRLLGGASCLAAAAAKADAWRELWILRNLLTCFRSDDAIMSLFFALKPSLYSELPTFYLAQCLFWFCKFDSLACVMFIFRGREFTSPLHCLNGC